MPSHPFEDDNGTFVGLVNQLGQYSLWPTSLKTPEGWTIAFGPGSRSACVAQIEGSWTDMRPHNSSRDIMTS